MFKLLPIMMISNKKVNGVKVNYESYLIELINNANNFKAQTGNKYFKHISKQDHGECDAQNGEYYIDFKLMVPTKFMYYSNIILPDVNYNTKNGIIHIDDNKLSLNDNLRKKADREFVSYFCELTSFNFHSTLDEQIKNATLRSSINNMLVNKNILAFVPVNFEIDEYRAMIFIKKIFMPLFKIRELIDKDSFITYLQGNYFYILKYENGKFIFVDKVNTLLMSDFNDLHRLTSCI